ncbi:MAG: excinuclease ABC subunit UvrB [Phycisphaeraceae bacterium]|nr:excinuclease ABC subunit UvrB [Phycisphaeraceae bacterium]
MADRFQLVSDFAPMGDQPAAIEQLTQSIQGGQKYQTLLGATGTGKTFTMANVIARVNKPTLVISHNKTLAAQLYEEFKDLFPHNAVSYFVSYYDYYQPEAYIPQRDIYIEKDSSRNDDLDRLRLAATSNLVSRRDTIVVASVSCIFGLGSPDLYKKSVVSITKGQKLDRQDLLRALSSLQYTRAEMDFKRGNFRVRGDVVEIRPAGDEMAQRIELFGDTVDSLSIVNPLTGELIRDENQLFVYPAVHYMLPQEHVSRAVASIREELDHRVMQLRGEGKLLEAQRLMARTKYDLELIQEVGVCPGIENYSRHLDGRPPGAKPYTLMDYFPDASSGQYVGEYEFRTPERPEHVDHDAMAARISHDKADGESDANANSQSSLSNWLLIIDESHVTLPQMRAMYHGDRRRKETLVEHGFRLPSAMDNRPLRFEEIEKVWPQVVFVSATPSEYELKMSGGIVAEQVIRPTGLVDPIIEIRSASGQVPDLCRVAATRAAAGERTLVTTLTKRLAEDLASYLAEQGLRCRYLHSEIHTIERVEILRDLRLGEFDVLIGVNLLREGLDLPEVSLVGIMDADKQGFLRSPTSLIQQIGRAARNVNATVILYADEVTPSMQHAIDETNRRRTKQLAFNAEHNITPTTIVKAIRRGMELEIRAHHTVREAIHAEEKEYDRNELLADLEKAMLDAAQNLDFEKAAMYRDRIKQVKDAPELVSSRSRDSRDAGQPKPGTPGTKVIRSSKKSRQPRF